MLIGSKACIIKLKEELCCVQNLIKNVFNNFNSVKIYSWKFSNKSLTFNDFDGIVEKIEFSSTEVFKNQIFHVVLLELLIDRYLSYILVIIRCLVLFQLVSYVHLNNNQCSFDNNDYSNVKPHSIGSCITNSLKIILTKYNYKSNYKLILV